MRISRRSESDVQAVGLLDYASLFVPLLQLHADLGEEETALQVGQAWLEQLSPTDPEALHVFVELSFELGLLCSAWERFPEAVRAYKAAYAVWYRLRALVGEPERGEGSFAFIGKVLANLGTAYLHQQAFREAVAYLRCGQELLDREGDEEASIPRQNLALLRAALAKQGRFDRVWRESERLYVQLRRVRRRCRARGRSMRGTENLDQGSGTCRRDPGGHPLTPPRSPEGDGIPTFRMLDFLLC